MSKTQTSALFKNTNVSTVVEVVGMDDKVQQLCGMGFSEDKAKDALITYNNNVESACNHLVGM